MEHSEKKLSGSKGTRGIQFVDLRRQYEAYKNDIDNKIKGVIASSSFIMGPEVHELEDKLAAFVGVKHAIGCSSGTDAIQLVLMALNIGHRDKVITTPFTFIASAEVISTIGAEPIFVDIDEKTFNLDPTKLENTLAQLKRQGKLPEVKAIIGVSLFGQCADYDTLNAIAEKYCVPLIEDGAQSFGATYKGRRSCSLTAFATTSFFPAKPLGCFGDGGAVFTNHDSTSEKIRALRVHGQLKRYEHSYVGVNARLDTLQAAVLLAKLPHYEMEIERRNEVAEWYAKALKDKVTLPYIEPHNKSVFAQYTIQTNEREALATRLKKAGIPTAIHYPTPLHLQPCFSHLGYKKGDFPHAEETAKKVLSLPMHSFLTKEEVQMIAKEIP